MNFEKNKFFDFIEIQYIHFNIIYIEFSIFSHAKIDRLFTQFHREIIDKSYNMIKREKNIRFDKFFKDYRIINNKNIEIEIRYILDQLIERNNEILLFIILSKQFFQFHLKIFSV